MKSIHKQFFLILLTSIFFFCSPKQESDFNNIDYQENNSDSIFVKIANIDSAYIPATFIGGKKFINNNPKLLVVYNDSIEGKILFSENFNIKLVPKETGIYINYGLFKTEYYYPEKGDTLRIVYNGNTPTLEVINKNDYEYNVTKYIDSKIKKPLSFTEFLLVKSRTPKQGEYLSSREDYEKYYFQYNYILDSLYSQKKITTTYYNNVKKIKEIDFYNDVLQETHNLSDVDHKKIKNLIKVDSLLKYPNYRYFIKSFVDNLYSIGFKGKINSQIRESDKGFNAVFSSKDFGEQTKNYLLFYYLEDILKYYPVKTADLYKERFTTLKNKDIINYVKIINQKYSFDKSTNGIILKSINRQTKSLDILIKENKGKIIYLDFWASWCLPCREAMPSSKKLRAAFENKDVTFIFLSIDKDFDKWKSANAKEYLEFFKNSYIVANQDTSMEFKKLGLESIPRYLIFDRNGRLIYKNAPSPEDSETKEILNKLLTK
ncbi:TlpA family protein disulfide reductase [Chryseobacterium echinoideorum]|uniref:TlpA family protein disulfide reductase n=1 Tax=Chryseobacterium echinoideorum TaxID=1549648 RepID=UPI001184BDF2|nr:TlpA disulfide reductase family protein [Chryseobacterium echinoideorum]